MPAKGTAEWKGDVPTGTGTFTAGDSIVGAIPSSLDLRMGQGSMGHRPSPRSLSSRLDGCRDSMRPRSWSTPSPRRPAVR
jgi:hypothetical protein